MSRMHRELPQEHERPTPTSAIETLMSITVLSSHVCRLWAQFLGTDVFLIDPLHNDVRHLCARGALAVAVSVGSSTPPLPG